MPELVEVRFKGNRKAFYTWDNPAPLLVGDAVVVEAERGVDLGMVSAVGETAQRKCGVGCNGCALTAAPKDPAGRVVRQASSEDSRLSLELRKAEEDVRRKVIERVRAHALPMKVSDAEWQWDRKKLTVYFTAEQRVDFRGLVRDLASLFRTRIELRQIGARDEAKRLDGVGRCGRQYCCSSWLPELKPVSLSLAKDQHLSLNPSQISGGCGRLLCCLRYEHDFYVESRKRFPKEGKTVRTARGLERVQAVDIFRERVLLRAEDGTTRIVALAELQTDGLPAQEPSASVDVALVDEAPLPVSPVEEVAPEISITAGPPSPPPPPPPPESAAAPASGAATPGGPPRRRRRRRRRRRGPGRDTGGAPGTGHSPDA